MSSPLPTIVPGISYVFDDKNESKPNFDFYLEADVPPIFFKSVDREETIEKQPLSPSQRFWQILHEFNDSKDLFADEVRDLIDVDLINYEEDCTTLERVLSQGELEILSNALEWLCIIHLGNLPYAKSKEAVKKFLGLDYFIDILAPVVQSQHESKWTIATLFEYIATPEKFFKSSGVAQIIGRKLADEFSDYSTTDCILFDIGECYDLDKDEKLFKEVQDIFDNMDLNTRVRWALFASMTNWHDEKDRGITSLSRQWDQFFSKELISLLEHIDTNWGKKQSAKHATPKRPIWECTIPLHVNSLKLIDPHLPNWMRNGGNSCYISSSLWGLFLLLDDQVQEKIRCFEMEPREATQDPLKRARLEFVKLYKDLASKQLITITGEDVNAFRRSAQLAFPWAFSASDQKTQEDAFEFLSAVIVSLLDLDECKESSPKFYKTHHFTRVDDKPLTLPDSYDYQEAFKSISSPEPLPLINIRIDSLEESAETLNALLTEVRLVDPAMERHAYKKDNPKEFQAVTTQHTEQFRVESKERAPDFFIARLARFSADHVHKTHQKLFNLIYPNATVDFSCIEDDSQKVCYDLVAVTVHRGETIESGHYYTYFRKEFEKEWNFYIYDDITGVKRCDAQNESILDIASNGYIAFYKKREEGRNAPPILPFESQMKIPKKEALELPTLLSLESEMKLDTQKVLPESPQKKKTLKRPRDSSDAAQSVLNETPAIEELHQIVQNCTEAKEWVKGLLNADFTLIEVGFSSIEELLSLFDYEVPELTKRAHSKDREILLGAARALQRPIYLIEPHCDKELLVIDSSFIFPGENFRHGEEFSARPIYLFRQANRTSFVIIQKD